MTKYYKFRRFVAYACVFGLLNLMVGRLAFADTNNGYQGNTISGRPSIAIVDGPSGIQVNTFLGNMFLPRRDVQIPGRGLPIEVELTYNSNQNSLPSPFGFGWRFNYHMSVIRLENDDVIVTWADGRRDLFQLSGGIYIPVNENVFATLEQSAPNVLRLVTKKQIQYLFDRPAPRRASFLRRIEDPNGNALTFTYESPNRLTGITDASGRSITLGYANGRVITLTDSNAAPARVLQYGYDALGNQTSFTDPLGNMTTYSYDSGRRMTKITDPLGVTDIAYAAPNLTVASLSRSTLSGTMLSQRSFFYDTATKTTAVMDFLNDTATAVARYKYDANNRLIETTDPLGHIETRTYDAAGNITSITDANGNTIQYTYDSRGNVQTITDGRGEITTFTYDPVFNKLASVTDANNHTATFSYDSRGNFTSLQDPLGNTTEYSYDGVGQLVSRRNARGFPTTFTYDSFGNRTSITDPLNHTRTLTYDGAGNVLSRKDANGNTTLYSYDARNRLRNILYPDSTQASLTYDSNDNLLSAVDPNTNHVFAYDADNQLIQVTDNLSSKTISYQYDGVGNRVQMTGPESAVTTYNYDLASRLEVINRGGQQFDYDYDNGDRLIKLTFPNGSSANYSYDAANNLLELMNRKSDNSVISSFAYDYDDAGNRTRLTQVGGEQIDYSYDARNQLIRELRTGGMTTYDHEFAYDQAGNRMQFNAGGVITTYSYNAADQLNKETTGGTATTYEYDANGNQIRKITGGNTFTYGYDFRDRQIAFSSPTASSTYSYDVLNRRIAKSVDGTTTQFFYDDLDAVAEYDGGGVLKAQYLYGPGIDANLAKFVGGNSFYFMRDGLNSIRSITDASQTVQNRYDYDAWGNILLQLENVANDYTFTGRESDDESGLYYYRARMYDPLIGRFTQVDPYDNNSGRSLYLYVDNNPVDRVDPLGLWGWLAVIGVIAAVVGVIKVILEIVKLIIEIVREFTDDKKPAEEPQKSYPPKSPEQKPEDQKPKRGPTRGPKGGYIDEKNYPSFRSTEDDTTASNGSGDGRDGSYGQGSTASNLNSHNVTASGKFGVPQAIAAMGLAGFQEPFLVRGSLTATNNSNLTNDFSDIAGTLTVLNFVPRTLIESVEFSFLQGTSLGGGDLTASGDGTAQVNGVLTNITFDAAKIEGVITFEIRNADTGVILAGGIGEPGRAALELAINPL